MLRSCHILGTFIGAIGLDQSHSPIARRCHALYNLGARHAAQWLNCREITPSFETLPNTASDPPLWSVLGILNSSAGSEVEKGGVLIDSVDLKISVGGFHSERPQR